MKNNVFQPPAGEKGSMSSEYEIHRQRQLSEARNAFNTFLGRLTPGQRARLEKISEPVDDIEQDGGRRKVTLSLTGKGRRRRRAKIPKLHSEHQIPRTLGLGETNPVDTRKLE
jgi:hypothetical protein